MFETSFLSKNEKVPWDDLSEDEETLPYTLKRLDVIDHLKNEITELSFQVHSFEKNEVRL
jgi:hypothetical protein